jgi:uncharacterized protein YbjT (DUF2867 family)
MNLLILGASGLVGRNALEQALAHPSITRVFAPTRKPLTPHPKLTNPVSPQLERLLPEAATWGIDAVICAIGTTIGQAGSKEAFRQIDYALPLSFAKLLHQHGTETFALVSATGASVSSAYFYAKTKGEIERDITLVGFRSLTIVRPTLIDGNRDKHRLAEGVAIRLARILAPILPKKFHVNPAPTIAAALVNAVIAAEPGCHFRYAESLV